MSVTVSESAPYLIYTPLLDTVSGVDAIQSHGPAEIFPHRTRLPIEPIRQIIFIQYFILSDVLAFHEHAQLESM
jgi:hypothetical protein